MNKAMKLTPATVARCDRCCENTQRWVGKMSIEQVDDVWHSLFLQTKGGLNGQSVMLPPAEAVVIADLALAGLYLLIMREQERIDQEEAQRG